MATSMSATAEHFSAALSEAAWFRVAAVEYCGKWKKLEKGRDVVEVFLALLYGS